MMIKSNPYTEQEWANMNQGPDAMFGFDVAPRPTMSWGGEGGGFTSPTNTLGAVGIPRYTGPEEKIDYTDPNWYANSSVGRKQTELYNQLGPEEYRRRMLQNTTSQPFDLSGIYGSRDPNQVISGQTGMPTTRATAQSATPWTPKKGIFQDNVQTPMGDYGQYGTPMEKYDRGMWKADPNVDYGQAPEQGMVPVFDKEGNHYGWEEPHSYSTGGSGLFGDMGEAKTWKGYYYDANGNLQAGSGGVTPSKSGATKFMSYAMPIAMMAGLGAGAAGGAFSGGAAAGGAGAEAGAGAGGLVELGGGGAGFTGSTAATGGATSLSALPGAGGSILSGGGSITELLTKYGPKVLGALTQMGGGQGGQGGQGGGGPGILDILGGYYSGQQMKDYSGNMKEIYSNLLNRQDQFRNQLLKSYEDPNQFYGSNQWKGLESVYQNSIDRNAAKGGTLANPTDRERLLQSYAMKELENYRGGLRQAAGMTNPENALDALAKGYQAEAYANLGPWATASRGGTGSVGNIVNTITSGAKTAGEIWDFLKDFFDDEG